MPFASCAAVQLSVGLPATAGGAVRTGGTSGTVLSTMTLTGTSVWFPAMSVMTARTQSAPSPTAAAVVFQLRAYGALLSAPPRPVAVQLAFPFAERCHCTVGVPFASAALAVRTYAL